MARSAPGGGVNNLHTTITALDSGPYSYFYFVKPNTPAALARILHIGTGTGGQLVYTSAAGGVGNSYQFEQQFATSQIIIPITEPANGAWNFASHAYDGSTLTDGGGNFPPSQFLAEITMPGLSDSLEAYRTHTDTDGVGARTTGLVDLYLLNRLSGLNREYAGEIFAIGMVPWMVSGLEMACQRRGRLSWMTMRGTPQWFFGLEGSDLNSYAGLGPSLTLTNSGTSATSDPIAIDTDNGVVGYVALEGNHETYNSAAALVTSSITPLNPCRVLLVLQAEANSATGVMVEPTISDSQGHTWRRIGGDLNNGRGHDTRVSYWTCENSSTSAFTISIQHGARTIASYKYHVIIMQGSSGTIPDVGQWSSHNDQNPAPDVVLCKTPAATSLVLASASVDNDGANHAGTGQATELFVAHSDLELNSGAPQVMTETGQGVETTYTFWQANLGYSTVACEFTEAGANDGNLEPRILLAASSRSQADPFGTGTYTTESTYEAPPDDSLLVAIVSYETNNTNTAPDITFSDSASHVWTQQVIADANLGVTTWGQRIAIFTAPHTSGAAFTASAVAAVSTSMATWKVHIFAVTGNYAIGQTKKVDGSSTSSTTLTFDSTPAATSLVFAAVAYDNDGTNGDNTCNRGTYTESDNSPVMSVAATWVGGTFTSYTWTNAGAAHSVAVGLEITQSSATVHMTGSLTKQVSKPESGAMTPTGALARAVGKSLAGNITPTGAQTKLISKTLTGSITPSGSLVRTRPKSLSGSLTPSGALTKQVAKALAGTITPTGSITKLVTRTITAGLTPAGTITKQVSKLLSGGITPNGSLSKSRTMALSGSITPSGGLTKQVSKPLSGALTPSGLLTKLVSKTLTSTLTSSGTVTKARTMSLGGTISPAGALIKQTSKQVAGALTPSGSLAKQTSRSLSSTLTSSGSLTRQTAKAVAGLLVPTGSLTRALTRLLTGDLTPTGSITRQTSKNVAGGLVGAGNVTKTASHTLTGSVTPTGFLGRSVAKLVTGQLTPTGQIVSRFVTKILSGEIFPHGSLTAQTGNAITLGGTLGPTSELTKFVTRTLVAGLTPTGSLDTTISKTFTGSLGSSSTITREVSKGLAGDLLATGTCGLLTAKTFGGSLGMAGDLQAVFVPFVPPTTSPHAYGEKQPVAVAPFVTTPHTIDGIARVTPARRGRISPE